MGVVLSGSRLAGKVPFPPWRKTPSEYGGSRRLQTLAFPDGLALLAEVALLALLAGGLEAVQEELLVTLERF